MRAQLLMESIFALVLAISFVVFALVLFTGIYRYYQSTGAAMDRMYENASASADTPKPVAHGT